MATVYTLLAHVQRPAGDDDEAFVRSMLDCQTWLTAPDADIARVKKVLGVPSTIKMRPEHARSCLEGGVLPPDEAPHDVFIVVADDDGEVVLNLYGIEYVQGDWAYAVNA